MPVRTWFPVLGLAVFSGMLAGPPANAPRPASERLALAPHTRARFGIDEPFTLRLPIPLPAAAVARSVAGGTPLQVKRVGAVRYRIFPRGFWPGERAVHLRVRLTRLSRQWPWPAPVLQDTLYTGADVAVDVSLSAQEMTVYEGATLLRMMPVSTGAWPQHVTPTGRFYIFRRVPVEAMTGGQRGTAGYYRVEHVPYSQYIFGGIAIHGAWWANTFGVPRSHGCIQLATRTYNPDPEAVPEDAGWLWSVTRLGTPVTITGTTPRIPSAPARLPEDAAQHDVRRTLTGLPTAARAALPSHHSSAPR